MAKARCWGCWARGRLDLDGRRAYPQKTNMFRSLHAITVMLAILICPIRCMGTSVDDATAVTTASAFKCGCCHHAGDSDSSPEQPTEGSDDCGCASCLCHGALRGDDGNSQAPEVLLTSFLVIATESFAPQSTLSILPISVENSPPCLGGMLLRIVQQSFLC